MFVYKSTKRQIIEERRERESVCAGLNKTSADIDYIAMMCDVELETEEFTDEQI